MPHKRVKHSVREQLRKENLIYKPNSTKKARGLDLGPTSKDSISNEDIPKSAQRVLNALKIREDFKLKKRKLEAESDSGLGKRRKIGSQQLQILPGESIQHFNRRVEDDLRPLVKSAVDSGRAVARKALREELEAKQQSKAKKGKGKATTNSTESDQTPSSSKSADPVGELSKFKSQNHSRTAVKATLASPAANRPPKDFLPVATSAPKRLNDIAMAPPELKTLPRGAAAKTKLGGTSGSKADNVVSMAQKVMMEQEREKAIKRYRDLKAAKSRLQESSV